MGRLRERDGYTEPGAGLARNATPLKTVVIGTREKSRRSGSVQYRDIFYTRYFTVDDSKTGVNKKRRV